MSPTKRVAIVTDLQKARLGRGDRILGYGSGLVPAELHSHMERHPEMDRRRPCGAGWWFGGVMPE